MKKYIELMGGMGIFLVVVSCITLIGFLSPYGIYHSFSIHSFSSGVISIFVPPFAWYRAAESFFEHDDIGVEPTLIEKANEKVVEEYFSTLDGWVKEGGPVREVQDTVVETCGKLVIATVGGSEVVSLATTQKEEFHFRVDVCTKMTVNRVHPQPEFEKKELVEMICDDSKIVVFKKLCRRSGLR